MDAKELRGLLEKRLAGSRSGDHSDDAVTKPGGDVPFHLWWYDEYLSEAARAFKAGQHSYLSEAMLELSDEELMFLWAVYLM